MVRPADPARVPPRVFRRLRMACDVPARVDWVTGVEASPRLAAGDVVYAYPGRTLAGPGMAAATLEPGGPWFTVPADTIEEA